MFAEIMCEESVTDTFKSVDRTISQISNLYVFKYCGPTLTLSHFNIVRGIYNKFYLNLLTYWHFPFHSINCIFTLITTIIKGYHFVPQLQRL